MKKVLLTLILTLLSATLLWAQAPQGFTYQAVVRNADGTAVSNRTVSVKLSFIKGSASGTEGYAELHYPTTDAGGLFTVIAGQGMGLVNCPFSDCVDWTDGPWFLRSQIDPDGGENYRLETVQQLMSVPYALYSAHSADGGSGIDAQHLGDSLSAVLHEYIDNVALGTIIHDTLIMHDTVLVRDSVVVYVHDSTVVHDSVFIRDSVVVNILDSTVVHIRDSVIVHLHDSVRVYLHDSLVYDTIHLHPYDSSPADTEGALPGVFSISVANRVAFSRGNLQYKASTGTWRFAEHQYDMVGTANANISETYDGWIDLFGYGTSRYPYTSSASNLEYVRSSIAGTSNDWGIYNAISNGGDSAGLFRTLSGEEWAYILNERENASNLRALATVFGMPGLILLPDAWGEVDGLQITITASDFTTNTFTAEEWGLLETVGAVFLPACGYRSGHDVSSIGSLGQYWSSTYSGGTNYAARQLKFSTSTLSATTTNSNSYGLSVRLVRDLTALP